MTVAAAAIGGDHQAAGAGIALVSHRPPPAANRLHGEAGGIVVRAHTHPILVIGDVINSCKRYAKPVLCGTAGGSTLMQ